MHNREEKWNEIKQEYRKHTMSGSQAEELKRTIARAKKQNRHTLGIIAAAAASIAILLTILPNASGSAAYAMSRIPILSKWVEVVTFRDYQYESARNTANIHIPEIVPQTNGETGAGTEETETGIQENLQRSAEEINAEIKAITEPLIQEFKENLKSQEGCQDMIVESEVIATAQNYFTLKLICYQGAGSGAEWHYFYTIDFETGKRLLLKDLFSEGSSYISVISENIIKQMKAQMEEDENITYWVDSDIPEWDFKTITDETPFYLNENGEVVISFNEGDVGPMCMGCVEFVIPNEILEPIRR